jgi:hypothetical protein
MRYIKKHIRKFLNIHDTRHKKKRNGKNKTRKLKYIFNIVINFGYRINILE